MSLLHNVTFTLITTDHYGDLSYIIQSLFATLYHHRRTPFVFCKGKCPLVLKVLAASLCMAYQL